MKAGLSNHIEKFENDQIWILRNGRMICLKDVMPMTKIHSQDEDRQVEFFEVIPHSKKLNSDLLTVESKRDLSAYDIKTSETKSCTYDDLNKLAVTYIGKVVPQRMDLARRAYNDTMI